ncbi:anti-sigma factor [Aeromicrobium sp. Marseille-Q0843]|uniref:Regulator of SigK n=1 Tax=Aeromicrobium phoceense TaxID=2754045 RepID=A0A838XEN8_9ACTN|nr:anti-sigma factor [Aeromicrobium phoceense]MBA4609015.1 anti-sigma factor [Aeromicrobium phoceense]
MSDVHALSGAYALDAVTDAERESFERHMAGCEACQAEVASLRETAAVLTELSLEEPPPALRQSVLAAITEVRQLPPEPARRSRRHRFDPRLLLVAAASAVVLAAGVGVAITEPWNDGTSQVLSATDRVLEDPQAQRVTQTFDDGASATVVRSAAEKRAVLVTHDMPAAPEGHSYVVWLQQGDEMVKAATMPQGPDNTVLLEGDALTASAAGVTVEEDPDTSEPTSDPIALFAF